MFPALRRTLRANRTRVLALVCALAGGVAMLPSLAESTPSTLFSGSTEAQSGTANATDVANGAPHFSWTNTSGGPVDRQRMQVWSSPDTNVVAHWRLDGDGLDSSGNGRALTLPGAGANPTFVAGQSGFGQAASFDGVNDYLTRPADGAFDMANNFTVEAWFRLPAGASAGNYYILEKGGGGGSGRRFQLGVDAGGAVEATITSAGGDQYLWGGTARSGAWHHVAVTLDLANTCRLYLDGAEVSNDTTCGPATDGVGDPLMIGRWGLSSGGWNPGEIDEVRISSVARTGPEVLGAYRTGLPHHILLWDSDTSDTGVAMPSCAAAARCTDIEYGATGTPSNLVLGGARYHAIAKHRLGAAGWTAWSSFNWFETTAPTNGTFLSTDDCDEPRALSFGATVAGTNVVTGGDCRLDFGGPGLASIRIAQADGGGSALRRATTGTLDTGFGAAGTATFDAIGETDYTNDAKVLPDGSTIVVGETCAATCRFAIHKLRPNGTYDTSFGSGDGHVEVDFPSLDDDDTAMAVDVGADGRIVVAGSSNVAGHRLALLRLTPAGVVDTTFGSNGTVVDNTFETASAVLIRRDGRILVSTHRGDSLSQLVQYLPSGALDRSWGTDGIVTVDTDVASAQEGSIEVHELSTGKLLLLSWALTGGDDDLVVTRLTAAGALDPTYGVGGRRALPANDYTFLERDSTGSAVSSSGAMFVATERSNGTDLDAVVTKVAPDGAIDTTFGVGGHAVFPVGTEDDYATGLALDPAGGILVGGPRFAGGGTTRRPWVARVTAAGILDPTFNGGAPLVLANDSRDSSIHRVRSGIDGSAIIMATSNGGDGRVTRLAANAVADYAEPTRWSNAASTGLFGACLRAAAPSASSSWGIPGDAACDATDADPWRGIPEGTSGTGVIARTSTTGTNDAWVALRFGARAPAAAPAGAYAAPLVVEVVSPELTPPVSTGAPTIGGTAAERQTLRSTTGTWTNGEPPAFSYAWLRCDAGGANCARIGGGTSAAYVPDRQDIGSTLRVDVTARNASGHATARSAATAVITAHRPNITYATGFEHGIPPGTMINGSLAVDDYNTGTMSVVGAPVRNGSKALQVSTVSDSAFLSLPVTATTVQVARGAARMAAAPTEATAPIEFVVSDGVGYAGAHVMIQPDRTLTASLTDIGWTEQNVVSGPQITLGAWTVIEMALEIQPTGLWVLRWRINGVEQTPTSYSGGANFLLDTLDVGLNDCGCTDTVQIDDIAISKDLLDYPLGDGKVLGYAANAIGTHAVGGAGRLYRSTVAACNGGSDLNGGDPAVSSHTYLDDWPVVAGADYVCAQTAGGYAEYDMPATAETANPDAVQLIAAYGEAAASAGNTITVTPVHSGTPGTAITADPTTQLRYGHVMMRDRPGATGWTAADLDGLRYRISSSDVGATQPRIESVLAEVDFPITPGTSAPTSTIVPGIVAGSPPEEGDLLVGTSGSWGGTAPIAHAYQWQRCTPGCVSIAGAVDNAYLVTAADIGATLVLQVTGRNTAGSLAATSAPTATVIARASTRPESTDAPQLTGVAVVGRTMTSSTGTWDGAPTAFAYQWERCDAGGGSCSAISGATTISRVLVAADAQSRTRLRVTATNAAGTTVTMTQPGPLVKATQPSALSTTGFEAGLLSTAGPGIAAAVTIPTVGDGDATVEASARRSGRWGLRTTGSGAVGGATVDMPGTVTNTWRIVRTYVRVEDLPDSGTATLVELDDGATAGIVRVTSTGVLEARSGAGTVVTGPTITTGRWYRIDVRHLTQPATHVLEWMVDGAPQATASHVAGSAANGTYVRLGISGLAAGSTAVATFDDYTYSATVADYPLGGGAVLPMRIEDERTAGHVGAGNFQNDLGAAFSALDVLRIDDEPMTTTASGYVHQQVAGAGNWLDFHLTDPDVRFGATAVRGIVQFHSNAAGAMNGSTQVVRSDASTANVFVGNMATGATLTTQGANVTAPGSGWSVTELDALHVRIGNVAGPYGPRPWWDAFVLEADIAE